MDPWIVKKGPKRLKRDWILTSTRYHELQRYISQSICWVEHVKIQKGFAEEEFAKDELGRTEHDVVVCLLFFDHVKV